MAGFVAGDKGIAVGGWPYDVTDQYRDGNLGVAHRPPYLGEDFIVHNVDGKACCRDSCMDSFLWHDMKAPMPDDYQLLPQEGL